MAEFVGDVKVSWLKDPRKMQLLDAFQYQDKKGIKWDAPIDSVIDGASIPRFFWRFIGSPFIGKYRRASVIHDVYCVTKSSPHKQVHRMFYEAMRVDGVSYFKAKAMYLAVKVGGPKW
ncbi:MAG: DUF1353 domain-containing protein [Colwellia sp.]|nr:DUF1353 domain-containing protein [Colwellia sp.]